MPTLFDPVTVGAITGPGHLVEYATTFRSAGFQVSAVGLSTEAEQAASIISERADAVFVARTALRARYWALRAAHELGASPRLPDQYLRGAR